jgi:hypothetical protein
MYTVIRKGGLEGSIKRAKQLGYWDAENEGAIVKQFERLKDAEEYAEACNSMWTELTEFPLRKPTYVVVAVK